MNILIRLTRRSPFLLSALLILAATPRAFSQTAAGPSAPAATTGNYTVGVSCSGQCMAVTLNEKVGPGGTYTQIATGSVTFTNKPVGTYSYMAEYYVCTLSSYGYICQQYVSDETTVHVVQSLPDRDHIETQLDFAYESRAGDINSDGKTDLFVRRTSGGEPYNGVIEEVLLEQTSSGGSFQPIVPSASQAAVAASWPLSGLQVELEDFNVDGFVDVLLKGVGGVAGPGSTPDQIIYASGQVLDPEPLGLRAVDDSLTQFVGNSLDYFVNPDYYAENAPAVFYSATYWYSSCGYGYPDIDPIFQSYFVNCSFTYITLNGSYPDFSAFSQAALSIWSNESSFDNGIIDATDSTEAAQEAAEAILEVEIGGWPMEEELGSTGEHTDPDVRRGLETFWAILKVGRRFPDEVDSEEAPSQTDVDCITLNVRHVGGLGPLAQHASVVYRSAPVWKWLGGYDDDPNPFVDGTLISDRIRASDNPTLTMIASLVSPPTGTPCLPATDQSYWSQVVSAEMNYDDDLNYSALPAPSVGYNSNGFAHGILNATGGGADVNILDRLVGWSYPVPASAFE